jgi:hypothetical protein
MHMPSSPDNPKRRVSPYPRADAVVRFVEEVRKAGLSVAGLSCHPDGVFEIRFGAPLAATSAVTDGSVADLVRLFGDANGPDKHAR